MAMVDTPTGWTFVYASECEIERDRRAMARSLRACRSATPALRAAAAAAARALQHRPGVESWGWSDHGDLYDGPRPCRYTSLAARATVTEDDRLRVEVYRRD